MAKKGKRDKKKIVNQNNRDNIVERSQDSMGFDFSNFDNDKWNGKQLLFVKTEDSKPVGWHRNFLISELEKENTHLYKESPIILYKESQVIIDALHNALSATVKESESPEKANVKWINKFRWHSDISVFFAWKRDRQHFLNIPQNIVEPSKNLLFIAGLFYSAKEREIVLGDVEERFKKESKKFGRRKAHALIVRDLLTSIYPTTKAALVKLFKLATFYAILKRIIS